MGRFERLEFDKSKDNKYKDIEEVSKIGKEKYGVDYFLDKGYKAFKIGDYKAAIKNYSEALNLNNYVKEGWIGQILCLLCLGQYEDVLTWASQAEGFIKDSDFIAAKAFALNRLG